MRDFTDPLLNVEVMQAQVTSAPCRPVSVGAMKQRSDKVINSLPSRALRNSTFTLMALSLAACGGGSGSEDDDGTSSSASGNLVKGPVSGARVFVDYNGDGQLSPGEPTATTDENGFYSFENLRDSQSYEVVALLDGAVDQSSGRLISGGRVFKSTTDASVITPFTTMITDQGISPAQLIEALGLSGVDNFDPMNFNPYADDVDPADALLVEQTAQKVMTIVETLTTIFEASGSDSTEAYNRALEIVADQATTVASGEGDLFSSSSISAVVDAAFNNLENPVADPAALKSAVNTALETTFDAISSATELDTANENPEFKVLDKLLLEVYEAVQSDDAEKLTVDDAEAEDLVQEIVSNSAPELTLTSQNVTVSETTESLVVTTASATDADAGDVVTFSLSGADASAFIIDQETGVVSFKAQPNYEVKNSYSFEVVAFDGTEVTKKSVVVNVTDVTPSLTLSVNPALLTNLESTINADLETLERRVDSFYGNEEGTGFSQKIALIDFNSFGETDQDITFSSSGVSLSNSQGYRLDLAFTNFTPTSLEDFAEIASQFEASGDLRDLTISGGFQSITIYGQANNEIVAQLAHTDAGIEWRNPSSFAGDVDTFVIEGSFDNQIENYLSVFESLQEAYDPESGNIGDQALLDAVNALSGLVDFEGISAKVDDKTVFRIGADTLTEGGLEFVIDGAEGSHVVRAGISGSQSLILDVVSASGGEREFTDMMLSGAFVMQYDNWELQDEHGRYYVSQYIENSLFKNATYTYVSTWDIDDNYVGFYRSEIYDGIRGSWHYEDGEPPKFDVTNLAQPTPKYKSDNLDDFFSEPLYSSFPEEISENEYVTLLASISNAREVILDGDGPLNDLVLSFSYSYADELVISVEASEILSLYAVDDVDLLESAVVGGYLIENQPVTEVTDQQEKVALKLLGVDVDDFLEKQEALGGSVSDTIEFYLTPLESEILSAPV